MSLSSLFNFNVSPDIPDFVASFVQMKFGDELKSFISRVHIYCLICENSVDNISKRRSKDLINFSWKGFRFHWRQNLFRHSRRIFASLSLLLKFAKAKHWSANVCDEKLNKSNGTLFSHIWLILSQGECFVDIQLTEIMGWHFNYMVQNFRFSFVN